MSSRQVLVGFNQLEAGCFRHALAQEEGVTGTEEDDDAVAGLGQLDELRANERIALVPVSKQVRSWLIRARAHPQHRPVKCIAVPEAVRIIQEAQGRAYRSPGEAPRLLVDFVLGPGALLVEN